MSAVSLLVRHRPLVNILTFHYIFNVMCLRILTGKKAPSNKTPALTKSMNMDIWVAGTSDQLFIRDS